MSGILCDNLMTLRLKSNVCKTSDHLLFMTPNAPQQKSVAMWCSSWRWNARFGDGRNKAWPTRQYLRMRTAVCGSHLKCDERAHAQNWYFTFTGWGYTWRGFHLKVFSSTNKIFFSVFANCPSLLSQSTEDFCPKYFPISPFIISFIVDFISVQEETAPLMQVN